MLSQEDEVQSRVSELEKELILFKQDLFEIKKVQEVRGNSFEFHISSMRERIDSVMTEMKLRNSELTDKLARRELMEEKNHRLLTVSLERVNHKLEDVGEATSSFRERQIFNKEQIEKINDDISEVNKIIGENKDSLYMKLDISERSLEDKVEVLQKAYYTGTGIVLLLVVAIEISVNFGEVFN